LPHSATAATPLHRWKAARSSTVARFSATCHRARFDVRTGEVVTWANFLPGIQVFNAMRNEKPLKTYPVYVQDGHVMMEI